MRTRWPLRCTADRPGGASTSTRTRVPSRELSARRTQGGFADDLDWVAGCRPGPVLLAGDARPRALTLSRAEPRAQHQARRRPRWPAGHGPAPCRRPDPSTATSMHDIRSGAACCASSRRQLMVQLHAADFTILQPPAMATTATAASSRPTGCPRGPRSRGVTVLSPGGSAADPAQAGVRSPRSTVDPAVSSTLNPEASGRSTEELRLQTIGAAPVPMNAPASTSRPSVASTTTR